MSGAPADLDAMRALPMDRSLASEVVRTGQPISVPDLAADPRAMDPSSLEGWPQLGPVDRGAPAAAGAASRVPSRWRGPPSTPSGFQTVVPACRPASPSRPPWPSQVARAREDQQRLTLFEDRDRIGRDLHDLVIQRLFAVGLSLESAGRHGAGPRGRPRGSRQAVDDLDATIKDIRRTIFALGSLDSSADVQTEIERIVDRAAATLKFRPTLRFEGPVRTLVGAHVAPDLLAVLGEALSNASRHADASAVEVVVSAGDQIERQGERRRQGHGRRACSRAASATCATAPRSMGERSPWTPRPDAGRQ